MAAQQPAIESNGRLGAAWEGSSSWRYRALALLAVALGLRLWTMRNQTFWIDEFTELLISSQEVSSLSTFHDGFPPLGFLFSRGWLEWGSFETARYLAVGYGIVTVALIGLASLRLGGKRAALYGLLISGLSPFLIWHSQELRPYSLVMMLAAASLLLLLRACETGQRSDWILYGIVSGLGLWTHYFFGLTVGAAMVWLWVRRRDIPGVRGAVMAHVVIAVMALPLLALLPGDLGLQVEFQAEVASEDPSSFGIGPLGFAFFSFFSGFSLGPSLRELHESSLADALSGAWVWLALFGVLAAALGWWVLRNWRNRWVQLLVTLVLLPVLLAGVLSVIADVGFRPRYVSWSIVPLLVLGSVALSRVSLRIAAIGLTVLVVVSGFAYANRHWSDRYANEDLRTAMAEVDLYDMSGEMPVLVSADYMAPLAAYYGPYRRIVRLPQVGGEGTGLIEASTVVAEASGGQPYLLLYTRAFHGDSGGLLLESILSESTVTAEVEFAGARLYRLEP